MDRLALLNRSGRWIGTRPIALLLEVASAETPLDAVRTEFVGGNGTYLSVLGAPNPNGFVDSDGVVSLDSGLGLFLGTDIPEYFSHE